MRIYIDPYFYFYTPSPRPWVELDAAAPLHLSAVLARLGIPPGEVHLAIVDGQAVSDAAYPIPPAAQVKLFPPFGGG